MNKVTLARALNAVIDLIEEGELTRDECIEIVISQLEENEELGDE